MYGYLSTGIFKAFNPHNWEEEKQLFDEMQDIADWTSGCRTYESFYEVIKIRTNVLNEKYKNKRSYDVYMLTDKSNTHFAQIIVSKYDIVQNPAHSHIKMLLPTAIGDFKIRYPEPLY